MTSYALIYNPKAGHKGAAKVAKYVAQRLTAAGHKVFLRPTAKAGDATTLAFTTQADVAVAIGGDGTINQVAEGLVQRREPPLLGIIPQGTVNNLARVLHIPMTPEFAVMNLLEGQPQPLDIGLVNDRVMISTLTMGVLANATVSISQKEKQRFGPLVFLARGLRSLSKNQHWQLTIKGANQTWHRDTAFLLITMTNSVGGFLNIAPQAKPDDGLFHVFVAPKMTWGRTLLLIPYFLAGKFDKLPGMTYFATNELTITSPGAKLKSRIDGDPSTCLPLQMKVATDKVHVIVKPSLLDQMYTDWIKGHK
ncbi:MAG: diacylglycerol kinase family lipid kinase [Lacticaseibacillus songhuajiangensis]|jgi:YegS/Rv2252/BmrU family lipid kinase|nr:diacylglycerol kinase family lipid kinase [Lacticaseibacillus songhuajiangensis]